MTQFTLDQLAHFDRCLHPSGFEELYVESAIELGFPKDDADLDFYKFKSRDMGRFIKRTNLTASCSIITLYQNYVLTCFDQNDQLKEEQIFNHMLTKFFQKR